MDSRLDSFDKHEFRTRVCPIQKKRERKKKIKIFKSNFMMSGYFVETIDIR